MRIVLQDKSTGSYLADVGLWTRDSREAMDFTCSTSAMEFCARNGLEDSLQIVLKFEQEKCEIVMQTSYASRDQSRSAIRA